MVPPGPFGIINFITPKELARGTVLKKEAKAEPWRENADVI